MEKDRSSIKEEDHKWIPASKMQREECKNQLENNKV